MCGQPRRGMWAVTIAPTTQVSQIPTPYKEGSLPVELGRLPGEFALGEFWGVLSLYFMESFEEHWR